MNTKRGLVLSAGVLVLAAAVAFVARTGPSAPRSLAQAPAVDGEYGYLDQTHRTYLLAQFNPQHPGFGGVVLAIEGLGAVWTAAVVLRARRGRWRGTSPGEPDNANLAWAA